MAYLIYTDRKNLLKTVKSGLIRIPRNLEKQINLHRINKGDTIFLFNYENSKLYGPLTAKSKKVVEEKNPKEGPFNGFGRVDKHYIYDSIHVDCTKIYKRGVLIHEYTHSFENVKFFLSENEELDVIEKLKLINFEKLPVIMNFAISDDVLKATVVKVSKGTNINNYTFKISKNLFALIDRKKRIGESFLKIGKEKDFVATLKEIGTIIYDNILKKLNIEKVFGGEGYSIYIAADERTKNIPFEITYRDSFIFENNTVVYRGEEEHDLKTVHVDKVLILADPSRRYRFANHEGHLLYDFLYKKGVSVDFVSRPLDIEIMSDLFSYYDIIHFAGHSGIHDSKTGWDIGKSIFTVHDIMNQRSFPHLIFSSSCGNTLSLGLEFLNRGARNVISSRWQIPDSDISDFVLSFYNLLFSGLEIGDAFSRALNISYKNFEVAPLLFLLHGESRMIYERQNS